VNRVWLPGWHTNSHIFDAIRAEFNENSDDRVLSFADTTLSRDEWLAEQVASLDEGVTLVGWSLGGMLACELADAFMARYQANPVATRGRFAQLVDPTQSALLTPFLLAGDQLASLQWLYDIDLRQRSIECPVHLLLAHDDRLVPFDNARQAWADQATSVTGTAGHHSLPLSAPRQVANWLSQHG
jgi:surfactin synthase thioesterase subunit